MDELDLWYGTSGPRDAEVVVVAESWGAEEAYQKVPLVGQSGQEFDRMLIEAGIQPKGVFRTNLFAAQPEGNDAWRFFHTNQEAKQNGISQFRGLFPKPWALTEYARLHSQLTSIKPKLVIALGNYALWALTECASTSSVSIGGGVTVRVPSGVGSWRGSMLLSDTVPGLPMQKVLPIYHPAAILRAWYNRAVTVHDLKRHTAALSNLWTPKPLPTVLAPPTFEQAVGVFEMWLQSLESGQRLRLAHDIETARGCITCMSFATGPYDSSGFAMVIPLIRLGSRGQFESYWTHEQELKLVRLARAVLHHPNCLVEGQNYLYDTQWIELHWGCCPNLDFDTMLAHHLLFPGTPKGLDYLSSLYCKFHRYWKDDNKEWDLKGNFEEHLYYNAEDALRTYECATVLRELIISQQMEEQWEWEKNKAKLALRMMRRGVPVNKSKKIELGFELSMELQKRFSWLSSIIPQSWVAPYLKSSKSSWWSSPAQQKILFFDILGLKSQTNRKTGAPTLNFEAIEELKQKYPEYTRIFNALLDARSIGVFHNTFVMAELEPNGRMVSSFNPAGTETFRWSSSTNAFWRGANLQNIPAGEEE